MFANIMGIKVDVINVGETGTFGCAIVGAVASGQYKSIEEASNNMVKISGTIEPDIENYKLYNKK